MSAFLFVSLITLLIILAGVIGILSSREGEAEDGGLDVLSVPFADGHVALSVHVNKAENPKRIIRALKLQSPRPTLFISGGAGLMSEEDIERTMGIMIDGVVEFAEQYQLTVIDGGTESGVMKMIGDARDSKGYHFPLVGVAPLGLISYMGRENPDEEATLEDGHSHFVLVEGNQWGDESQMIVDLTRAIAGGAPMLGILINGGKIAEQDVYLATAKADAEERIPMLVLEGSGRAADSISTALRTGETNSNIIRAIVKGGDIHLISLNEGAQAMFDKLKEHLAR